MQVLDLFYKVHKLFYIPFHNHLQQTMAFLGAYIYNIKDDERFLTAKSKTFKHILNETQNYVQQTSSANEIPTVRRRRNNQTNRDSSFVYSESE